MPLNLDFRVEDRGGVMVLVSSSKGADGKVRPASSAEVELWNALTKRFAAPARESYIRVNEQDLVAALMERDHLRRTIADRDKKILELESEIETLKTNDKADGQTSGPQNAATDDGGSPGGEPKSDGATDGHSGA